MLVFQSQSISTSIGSHREWNLESGLGTSSVHLVTRIGHNHGSIEGPSSSRFGRCLNRNDVIDFLPSTNNQIAQRVWIERWGNCVQKKSYRNLK